jgi:hypothetical protein
MAGRLAIRGSRLLSRVLLIMCAGVNTGFLPPTCRAFLRARQVKVYFKDHTSINVVLQQDNYKYIAKFVVL